MISDAELLWQVNHEYHRRLHNAQTSFSLLQHLLQRWEHRDNTVPQLETATSSFVQMLAQHRAWRYACFYAPPPTAKRMVQEQAAVLHALTTFDALCRQHQTRLQQINQHLSSVWRPDPSITCVSNGQDLWTHAETALHELNTFDQYLQSFS
jgi:hypothetical protein